MKILIIDDSFFQRKVVTDLVEEIGYEAILAKSGEEGLELLEKHKPDAITMDLLMPGMSGEDLLAHFKQLNNTVPVIVLSANIQETVKQRCLEAGASFFLNKPPNLETLKDCLDQIANR